jgi:hypothetical protein
MVYGKVSHLCPGYCASLKPNLVLIGVCLILDQRTNRHHLIILVSRTAQLIIVARARLDRYEDGAVKK